MALSIIFTLTCVLLSINAEADICGIPKIKPIFNPTSNNDELGQIVGGDEAVPHSFPWMVRIHIDNNLQCGGTIIGKKWILTAAHCMVETMNGENVTYRITVGSNKNSATQDKTLMYNISKYYDPGYNRDTLNNDIAVLELTREITFSDHVMPICLPELDDSATPELIATGWGETRGTGSDQILRQVKLTLITNEECNSHPAMQRYGYLNDKMICTQESVDKIGVCYGDGGGPLMSNDSEFTKIKKDDTKPWVLYGITSWGLLGCGKAGRPSVFTKVSHYVNWIHAIIRD